MTCARAGVGTGEGERDIYFHRNFVRDIANIANKNECFWQMKWNHEEKCGPRGSQETLWLLSFSPLTFPVLSSDVSRSLLWRLSRLSLSLVECWTMVDKLTEEERKKKNHHLQVFSRTLENNSKHSHCCSKTFGNTWHAESHSMNECDWKKDREKETEKWKPLSHLQRERQRTSVVVDIPLGANNCQRERELRTHIDCCLALSLSSG